MDGLNAGAVKAIKPIGRGGMGEVWEAWDARLERRVAVKLLHPYLFADEQMAERLLREARLAARAEHPGVVRIYRVDWVDGRLAIEMEFVEGGTLAEVLAAGPVSPGLAADLLGQLLAALAACHAQGVIHCDLKPGNILVRPDGRVCLTDFGISRALSAAQTDAFQSNRSGALWGTPQYAPPEAWSDAEPTFSWDLYAAGVVAYEAVAGTMPFQGKTTLSIMLEKHQGKVRPIEALVPSLSPALSGLITALIAKEASDRPPSATAALEALRKCPEFSSGYFHTRRLEKPAPSARVKDVRWGRPPLLKPWLYGSFISVALLLLVFSLFRVSQEFLSGPAADSAEKGAIADRSAAATLDGMESSLGGSVQQDFAELCAGEDFLFFPYDDGEHGQELWCLSADGRSRMVFDINPGAGSSYPKRMMFVEQTKQLVFSATTPELGEELWVCNTPNPFVGTKLVKDVLEGPMSSEPYPLASYDQQILFSAETLSHGRELWISTGSQAQTGLVGEYFLGGRHSVTPWAPAISAGEFVFYTGMTKSGETLCRLSFRDRTSRAICSSAGRSFKLLNGKLCFERIDDVHGQELWVYEVGTDTYALLMDIYPGPGGSDPSELYLWNSKLYFRAESPTEGEELWSTDGTTSGTSMAASFNAGSASSSPGNFFAAGNHLFFTAAQDGFGVELYRMGAEGGIVRVLDLMPGPESSNPRAMSTDGHSLVFAADDGVHGTELWLLDTTSELNKPELITDLRKGSGGSSPSSVEWLNHMVGFFVAEAEEGARQLYMLRVGTSEEGTVSKVELPFLHVEASTAHE